MQPINENFSISEKQNTNEPFEEIVKKDYLDNDAESQNLSIDQQLDCLANKTSRLEEKYVNDEIEKDLFQKFMAKYKTEKGELEQKLDNRALNSSNLENIVLKGLKIAENISKVWLPAILAMKDNCKNWSSRKEFYTIRR